MSASGGNIWSLLGYEENVYDELKQGAKRQQHQHSALEQGYLTEPLLARIEDKTESEHHLQHSHDASDDSSGCKWLAFTWLLALL